MTNATTVTVQTYQHIEDAPGFGAGWRTVASYRTKAEADAHAEWLVKQSHSLSIKVQVQWRDGYREDFVHRIAGEIA